MRKGFTLLELVFVIVIFGIMSKFGADILYKIYENYVFSNTSNRLLNQSESAVKQIANRLQYRIKDSTVARVGTTGAVITIGDTSNASGDLMENATVLEWIGTDIDGWRGTLGNTNPDWSGFIDLAVSSGTLLNSPGTATSAEDMAIFFIGSNVDLNGSGFGWNGTDIATQVGVSMHPITITAADSITTTDGNFSNVDVYEYYQLAKSAYAVHLDIPVGATSGPLYFYYGYQPWNAAPPNTIATASEALIMEDVSSFKFTSIGDILVIQVCVTDDNITGVGEYSICKEKVVF